MGVCGGVVLMGDRVQPAVRNVYMAEGKNPVHDAYVRHISWPRDSVPGFVKKNLGAPDCLYHSSGSFAKSAQHVLRKEPRTQSPRRKERCALGAPFWSRVDPSCWQNSDGLRTKSLITEPELPAQVGERTQL